MKGSELLFSYPLTRSREERRQLISTFLRQATASAAAAPAPASNTGK